MENKNYWTPETKIPVSPTVSSESAKDDKSEGKKFVPIIAGVLAGLVVLGGGVFYLLKYSPWADELTGGRTDDAAENDGDDLADDISQVDASNWVLTYDPGYDLTFEWPSYLTLTASQLGTELYNEKDGEIDENAYTVSFLSGLSVMDDADYFDSPGLTETEGYSGTIAIDGSEYSVDEYTYLYEETGDLMVNRLVDLTDDPDELLQYIIITFNDTKASDQAVADAYGIVMSTDFDAMNGWKTLEIGELYTLRYPSSWVLSKSDIEVIGGELIADVEITDSSGNYKFDYYLAPGGEFPVCKYADSDNSEYEDLPEELEVYDFGSDYFEIGGYGFYRRGGTQNDVGPVVCKLENDGDVYSTWLSGQVNYVVPVEPDDEKMYILDLIMASYMEQ